MTLARTCLYYFNHARSETSSHEKRSEPTLLELQTAAARRDTTRGPKLLSTMGPGQVEHADSQVQWDHREG